MRNEELAAIEIFKRELGARITAIDDGSIQGHVEALFTLPNGHDGALEVTTLGDENALKREAIAHNGDWSIEGAKWAWRISYGPAVNMRKLAEHYGTVILTCEALGVTSPDEASLDTPEFRWCDESEVRFHGFRETTLSGFIDVQPHGTGGAVAYSLEALPAWLEEHVLPSPLVMSKIAKLARTGCAEQHLFIRVHQSGLPFTLFDALGRAETLPTKTLDAPVTLTSLWLVPQFGDGTLVRWDGELGWTRLPLNP